MATDTEPYDALTAGGRLNGHPMQRQLTFEIAGIDKDNPEFGSLKLSGTIPLFKDLQRREAVQIVVTDSKGEVLVETSATVTAIHFKDEVDKRGDITTERIHTASVGY